jgi:hypothetical protein
LAGLPFSAELSVDLGNLNEHEKRAIHCLAELCNDGMDVINDSRTVLETKGLTLDDKSYSQTMRIIEHLGAIREVTHVTEVGFDTFWVSPEAVGFAREITRKENEAKKPGDVVAAIMDTARKNRWIAWIVIASIVATGLGGCVSLVNGVVSFGQSVGWIAKPPATQ